MLYKIDKNCLPEAEDLFLELEEVYEDVFRLRQQIETLFNNSQNRLMLQGFVEPGVTDLIITWKGAQAQINLVSKRKPSNDGI